VLAEVARRLTSVARTGEVVARTGGEEFAWLMPETDRDGGYQAADRARRAIEAAPFEEVGSLTISAGVCSNEHTRTAQELFSAADEALYRAKQSGRNMTVTHGPGAIGHRRPVRP
jgi:diguanylate cyclase (GGDEF)-like protein